MERRRQARGLTSADGYFHPLSMHVAALVREDGVWLTDGRREVGPYDSLTEALDDEDTKRRLHFGESFAA